MGKELKSEKIYSKRHKFIEPSLIELLFHRMILSAYLFVGISGLLPRWQRSVLVSHGFRIVHMNFLGVFVDHLNGFAWIGFIFQLL